MKLFHTLRDANSVGMYLSFFSLITIAMWYVYEDPVLINRFSIYLTENNQFGRKADLFLVWFAAAKYVKTRL